MRFFDTKNNKIYASLQEFEKEVYKKSFKSSKQQTSELLNKNYDFFFKGSKVSAD